MPGMYEIVPSATEWVGEVAPLINFGTSKIALTCFDNQHDWDDFEEFVFSQQGRKLFLVWTWLVV
jgi:hypothetical protein